MRGSFGLRAAFVGLVLGMVFIASCSTKVPYEQIRCVKSFDGETITYNTAGQKSGQDARDTRCNFGIRSRVEL